MSETPRNIPTAQSAEPGVEPDLATLLRVWWRIGVATVVAGQSMVFSLAVNNTPPDGRAYWLVHAVLISAALVVCVLLLPPLVRETWTTLRARAVSVELLFLLTLIGAFAASLTATFTHVGAVYYEVVSILLAIYSAGKTLGARSREKALRAVAETRERFDRVERLDGVGVSVSAVHIGERIRVHPGGAIGVDGIVRAGRSFVQETAMTGEWRPLSRGPGDPVLAGTHAIDGRLEIEVTAGAGSRRLDSVLGTVAAAQLAPSELQRQADRLTRWFLPLVIAVSAATFAFWTWRSGWTLGLFNSMAVLLVACPCALGLATPLAVFRGLSRLAELGLVARTGDVLDVLARADVVCFDKTGTLSGEHLKVKTWRIAENFAAHEAWLRSAVAAAERGLPHPIARALTEESTSADVPVANVRLEAGCGLTALADGRELRIGSLAWLGVDSPGAERAIAVTVDGEFAAVIELEEQWRAGATEVFAELRDLGVATEVLTGDPSWSGAGVGEAAVRIGLSPAEKTARIVALRAENHRVLFVGDGINDAGAMSAAHGAIAMNRGAALAQATAPAVFLGEDLRFLPAAIRLARKLRGDMATNMRFAAAYNALGMTIAAAGILHPVVAALLMLGSSAFVSYRALRR